MPLTAAQGREQRATRSSGWIKAGARWLPQAGALPDTKRGAIGRRGPEHQQGAKRPHARLCRAGGAIAQTMRKLQGPREGDERMRAYGDPPKPGSKGRGPL